MPTNETEYWRGHYDSCVLQCEGRILGFEDTKERALKASHRQNDHEWESETSLLQTMLNPQPGDTILDCGCGAGVVTERLASQAPWCTIIGFDISLWSLRTSKAIAPLPVFQAELARIPIRDKGVDISLVSGVMQHFQKPETVHGILEEVWRVTRRRVVLAGIPLSESYKDWQAFLLEKQGDQLKFPQYLRHVTFFDYEGFEDWCGPRSRDVSLHGYRSGGAVRLAVVCNL